MDKNECDVLFIIILVVIDAAMLKAQSRVKLKIWIDTKLTSAQNCLERFDKSVIQLKPVLSGKPCLKCAYQLAN